MGALVVILLSTAIVLLITGLIKPTLALFGIKNKTRGKVVLIYLPLSIFLFFSLAIFTTGEDNTVQTPTTSNTGRYFCGTIEYQASATGSNQDGVKLFKSFSASVYTIVLNDSMYVQVENTGLNVGKTILDRRTLKGHFVDGLTGLPDSIKAVDIDKLDEVSRNFAPGFYNLKLKETGKKDTICGYPVLEFKILKGGSIRENALATIWITNNFTIQPSRYMFENENKKFPSPVPLFVGIEKGSILKMDVTENNVHVIYLATKIDSMPPQKDVFAVPEFKLMQ